MDGGSSFWLTRCVFQRAMGVVYLIAFINAAQQFRPLVGEHGLLPAPAFVKQTSFAETPSLFHFFPTDNAFTAAAWLGILLSLAACLGLADNGGIARSVAVWGLLWALYMSFVNVGQIFYGFGWESILLEAGFYTIFLGPGKIAPPKVTIWMLRWLLFRIMFGAGMIKLRGDACWRDLSCLDYHYETQPMPNPLSWYFHWAPEWTHRAGVLINHAAELVAPFGYFLTSPISAAAGLVTMIFQGLIMATGNLSWLNFLTLILAIPTLEDRWLAPLRIRMALERPPDPAFQAAALAVGALTVVLSIQPVRNLISRGQMMNFSYNPLHLVGTYGAFGGITRKRYEIVIEGTADRTVGPSTVWIPYEFKGKPGDPGRRPPQIAPYHLRLDWLMWFAAMSNYAQHPWFVHLMAKLLEGDRDTLSLLRDNPFPGPPPHFVRAELYAYRFTTPAEHRATGRWWVRTLAGDYFPIVSRDDPALGRMLRWMGWS